MPVRIDRYMFSQGAVHCVEYDKANASLKWRGKTPEGAEDSTWSLEKKREGGGRVDADAREDENRRHDNFIQHTTPLSNKNALKACEKKRIHVGQRK
jgi:hypothetical protein